jgi:hypothetical protein
MTAPTALTPEEQRVVDQLVIQDTTLYAAALAIIRRSSNAKG